MDYSDSNCSHVKFSETTIKWTSLEYIAGKEDPVEHDTKLVLLNCVNDVE